MHARFGRGRAETDRREPARRRASTLRDEPVVAAIVAVDAEESMNEYAALEIDADLALDEPGGRHASGARPRNEGLELSANHFVKERLLGLVAGVVGDGFASGGTRSGGEMSPDQVDRVQAFEYIANARPRGIEGSAVERMSLDSRPCRGPRSRASCPARPAGAHPARGNPNLDPRIPRPAWYFPAARERAGCSNRTGPTTGCRD